jgi:hypothetical protein
MPHNADAGQAKRNAGSGLEPRNYSPTSNHAYHAYHAQVYRKALPPSGVSLFGKFLLTSAAILYLHTHSSRSARLVLFEEASQFQQIIDPKCRSTCGDAIEGVSLNHVCHVGHEGFKPAAGVVIEDPVLAPGELPRHQLVLGTAEGMERMDDPKSTYADAGTTCI